MAVVNVTVAPHQLASLDAKLEGIRRGVPRVLVRAINKVGRRQRTKLARLLSKETGLPKSEIDKRNVLWRGANFKKLEGKIQVKGGGIAVIKLRPRQTRKGVTYKGQGGKRVLIEKAFIATMPTGHKGVFKRARMGRAGWKDSTIGKLGTGLRRFVATMRGKSNVKRGVTPEGYAWRLPIKEQYTPGVLTAFTPHVNAFHADTTRELEKEIEVQTALVVERG